MPPCRHACTSGNVRAVRPEQESGTVELVLVEKRYPNPVQIDAICHLVFARSQDASHLWDMLRSGLAGGIVALFRGCNHVPTLQHGMMRDILFVLFVIVYLLLSMNLWQSMDLRACLCHLYLCLSEVEADGWNCTKAWNGRSICDIHFELKPAH